MIDRFLDWLINTRFFEINFDFYQGYFGGNIEHFTIWNTPLSIEQITELVIIDNHEVREKAFEYTHILSGGE